jgi:formate/nitrite transporter FocA (FNT family)
MGFSLIALALLAAYLPGREAPAGFWTVLVRAIFAGWLIARMVWLLPGAESARASIVTYLIGIGGFNHIIAGSNKVFFLAVSGQES